MKSLSDTWSSVMDYCRGQITEVAFKTWLEPLNLVDFDGETATISTIDEFPKKIITQKYMGLLNSGFENTIGFPVKIEIVVVEEGEEYIREGESSGSINLEGDLNGDEEYTFDTFVVGSSNRFAHAAAQSVATAPGKNYNPLFIYGNSGLGKTHLLSAICHEIKKRDPNANIIYTRGEDFTNEMINYLAEKNMIEFHNKYRNADILLIDDIQFISGKISTQEEFFHTFDALFRMGKQIVLTSDRLPKEILTLSERLRSRFESGLIADIQPPDLETRMAILKRKATALNLNIPNDVIQFIAEKIKTNIRQLEGTVKKMKALKSVDTELPYIILAQNAVRDVLSDEKPVAITVDDIISEVSKVCSVSEEDIRSKKQNAQTSRARQIAMYIVREITGLSTEAIGKNFGNKDHSTVIYSLKKIEKEMKNNSSLRAMISDITRNIREE
ncbi:MAG TPA: chromosomal replication initiator protein DnaA [Candidatus Onthovicinus excrementipullorum]|nr:chromosomal replication initiator protein DnaA [Candidatus Onthovicinus excrementipullorum]